MVSGPSASHTYSYLDYFVGPVYNPSKESGVESPAEGVPGDDGLLGAQISDQDLAISGLQGSGQQTSLEQLKIAVKNFADIVEL